jgi:hypothetical protein
MSENTPHPGVIRAKRAFGALLLGGFGTVWLLLWAYRAFPSNRIPMVAVSALGVGVLAWIYGQWGQATQAAGPITETLEEQRATRVFHLVNVGQWVVILVAGNVLANLGWGVWVLPMAVGVIGLHFFPLAKVLRTPSRYVTGTALLLVAVGYPLLSTRGPEDPVGCLLAGIVLWLSALWGLREGR